MAARASCKQKSHALHQNIDNLTKDPFLRVLSSKMVRQCTPEVQQAFENVKEGKEPTAYKSVC